MSRWDDKLRLYHAPTLMAEFGGDLVTVKATKDDAVLAEDIKAILGNVETYEVESQGVLQKRDGRWIDVYKSETEGINSSFIHAYIQTADDSQWDIVRIETETAAMYRLTCLRATNEQIRGANVYPAS